MTFEELKAEAKRQGYNLTKIPERITFTPCICGHNRRGMWYSTKGLGRKYKCNNCGFEGGWGKTNKEAKLAWNDAIKNYKEDKGE